MAAVRVANYRTRLPTGATIVNTTSHASEAWMRELSPFNLGPVEMTLHLAFPSQLPQFATNLENAWQFSKVYERHVGPDGSPTAAYFTWAAAGFNDPVARRFPMGKGAVPMYSLFVDPRTRQVQHLGYIAARKKIYAPLYAKYIIRTQGYEQLKRLVATSPAPVYLRDFDGYDAGAKTFEEILNDPSKKMGHAFVLARLIEENI